MVVAIGMLTAAPFLLGLLCIWLIRRGKLSRRVDLSLSVLSIILWILVTLITLGTMNVFGLFFLVIIAFGAGVAAATRRQSILLCVAIAVEKQMPLIPALESFAEEYRGTLRRRLQGLIGRMQDGATFAEAARKVKGVFPREGILAAQVGEEIGLLAPVLRRAARPQRPGWHDTGLHLLYLSFVVFVALMVCTFCIYYIVPKFTKIFEEFGTELPLVTQWLIFLSIQAVEFGLLWFPVVFTGFAAVVYLFALLVGWVHWTPPFCEFLVRSKDKAVILRMLAVAHAQERPLKQLLDSLARHFPRPGVRRRLTQAAMQIEQGRNWWESLQSEGLLSPAEAAVLKAAERAGNLTWALQEMAASSERKLAYRLDVWSQWLTPMAVFSVALPIAFFALGMFYPLIQLIEELM